MCGKRRRNGSAKRPSSAPPRPRKRSNSSILPRPGRRWLTWLGSAARRWMRWNRRMKRHANWPRRSRRTSPRPRKGSMHWRSGAGRMPASRDRWPRWLAVLNSRNRASSPIPSQPVGGWKRSPRVSSTRLRGSMNLRRWMIDGPRPSCRSTRFRRRCGPSGPKAGCWPNRARIRMN